MMAMHFGHVLTAMVTPFSEEGQIDYERLTNLIEHLLANGTEGLVINGTTGEASTLLPVEKEKVLLHVVRVVNKRVPVLAGTGTNDTAVSVEATRIAEASGADGIMAIVPYYNRPNQEGIYAHFTAIAESTSLPVMLYNVPGRTGTHMNADTVIRLSAIDNIIALKEASGKLDHTAEVIAGTSNSFHVYSGDDSMTLPMMAIGGSGVVSVASHLIGNELGDMIHAYFAGDVKQAAAIHQQLLPVMNGVFLAPSPAPVKAALGLYGVDIGSVRLPLVDLTVDELNQLKKIVLPWNSESF